MGVHESVREHEALSDRIDAYSREMDALRANEDGSIRYRENDALFLGGHMVESLDWWALWDGRVVWSADRAMLEAHLIQMRDNTWRRFGPGSECYSEGPVFTVTRTPVGITIIGTDGDGIYVAMTDREVRIEAK